MAESAEQFCIICHEKTNLRVTTNCDHSFCGGCILGWLTHRLVTGSDSLTCPTCRVRVTHLHAEEEEGVVAHLTMTYNELYGEQHMPANHEELRVVWLTGVRDIMVANGQPVNHIDAMLPGNEPGPEFGMDLNDIGMIQVSAILFIVAAIVTSHLVRYT